MKAWIDLYTKHRDGRTLADKSWGGELRKRLVSLSEAGHCDPSVMGRFTYTNEGGLVHWSIRTEGKSAPLTLRNLPELAEADLSLMAVETRRHHLHQFTIMVEGLRPDSSSWALAVHLPDDRSSSGTLEGDRQGLGACGHAALHCHVGPNLDTAPKVRVPLPPLGPTEIFDWVITQILPLGSFERAPWAQVEAALAKPTR